MHAEDWEVVSFSYSVEEKFEFLKTVSQPDLRKGISLTSSDASGGPISEVKVPGI